MAFVMGAAHRGPEQSEQLIGEVVLSVNANGRLVATMVWDMRVVSSMKVFSDADGPPSSTVGFTGSLDAMPPAVRFEKRQYVPFAGMACDAMPDAFVKGRPVADPDALLQLGTLRRTSDSLTQEEEMAMVRMAMNCWDYGRLARRYSGAVGAMVATVHGLHDTFSHPQELLHFAFDKGAADGGSRSSAPCKEAGQPDGDDAGLSTAVVGSIAGVAAWAIFSMAFVCWWRAHRWPKAKPPPVVEGMSAAEV